MWVVSAFILRKILGRQVTPAPSFVWRRISRLVYGPTANTAWNRAIIISLLAGIFSSSEFKRAVFMGNFPLCAPCPQRLAPAPVFFVVGFFSPVLGGAFIFPPHPIL